MNPTEQLASFVENRVLVAGVRTIPTASKRPHQLPDGVSIRQHGHTLWLRCLSDCGGFRRNEASTFSQNASQFAPPNHPPYRGEGDPQMLGSLGHCPKRSRVTENDLH